MSKTIVTIVLTVIAVMFSIQNFDHVPVYIFSGKAINIRMIFVISLSVVAGYLIRHFIGINREERLKRKIYINRKMKAKNGKKRNTLVEDDEL